MFHQPRAAIHAIAYVMFALCIAAAPLLPQFLPVAPVAYLIALLAQRRLPLLIVLRRFGVPGTDVSLTTKVLGQMAEYARIVWLEDPGQNYPLIRVKRHTVVASVFHILGVIGMWVQLRHFTPLGYPASLAGAAFIGVGSLLVIESGVGNPPYAALIFYITSWLIAGSSYGASIAASLQIDQKILILPLSLMTIAFLVTSIRHWFSPRTTISSEARVRSLQRRPRGYTRMKVQLLSTAPTLVDRIEVRAACWERVVSMLLKQACYSAIAITNLESATGLEWEILEARRCKVQVLYLCARSSADVAKAKLAAIVRDSDLRVFEYGNGTYDSREFHALNARLLWFFRPDKARKLLKSYAPGKRI